MTCNFYVYYRSARPADEVRSVVGAMQRALADETGVAGRLMRRADDPATWMEVYEAVADARTFELRLAAAVARYALERLLEPGAARHAERFVPAA